MRHICAKFCIPNSFQSPDIGQNSDKDISDFEISGQSFINENYHNSRTSHDIDIKLGPVTKLDKRNAATSKKIEADIILTNCGVIVFFQFMANLHPSGTRILDAWSQKLTFSLTLTFRHIKTENRLKKFLTQLSYYSFE